MNANATTSNRNPIATIIAAVLRNETSNLNRSAELIVHMFGDEANYSADRIASIIGMEAKERNALIDDAISDVSPEYGALLNHLRNLDEREYEKGDDDAKNTDRMRKAVIRKQMTAARTMFTRALTATFGLRKKDALEVKSSNVSSGALNVEYKVGETARGIKVSDKRQSCNDLIAQGEAALVEAKVKAGKTKTSKAKNPEASVLSDASKSLGNVLSSMAASGKRVVIEDMTDDVEQNMERVLRELFLSKFLDGETFDRKTFNEWLDATLKAEKEARDAIKRGQQAIINGEKEAAAAAAKTGTNG